MKRLFVAAALLALTVGLCVGGALTLEHHVDRLLTALDEVESAYRTGGAETAAAPVDQFADLFSEETRWFPLFLPHEQLDAAEDSATALSALLPGESAAFEAELTRCRRRLENLRDSERLTLENLL